VLAQRRPGLHRLLDREDEAFAALMLLVVRTHVHTLRMPRALFADSFAADA
jgi:hypothetical protein